MTLDELKAYIQDQVSKRAEFEVSEEVLVDFFTANMDVHTMFVMELLGIPYSYEMIYRKHEYRYTFRPKALFT